MAPTKDAAYSDRAVEDAIARVLDAERRARAEIAASQDRADAIRADARMRDKRIAEGAATRIAAIRAGMAGKRAARLAVLEAEAVGPDPQAAGDEAARARLDHAVARLADELVGQEPAE
jgi:hypothetical protein